MRTLFKLLIVTLGLVASTVSFGSESQANAADIKARFTSVELSQFIRHNHIPKHMAAKKQRVMLPPTGIQFDSRLMQKPKPGDYSLVYDALNLWPSDAPLPKVDHSAYLEAGDGQVIGVYVSSEAAKQLYDISENANGQPTPCRIYAIHIYNYANGPRLVVIGATTNNVTP